MEKRNNGQRYFRLTQAAIDFFNEEYVGGQTSLARASMLSGRTIAKALKKELINSASAKSIRKVLQDSGFKGNTFEEVI